MSLERITKIQKENELLKQCLVELVRKGIPVVNLWKTSRITNQHLMDEFSDALEKTTKELNK